MVRANDNDRRVNDLERRVIHDPEGLRWRGPVVQSPVDRDGEPQTFRRCSVVLEHHVHIVLTGACPIIHCDPRLVGVDDIISHNDGLAERDPTVGRFPDGNPSKAARVPRGGPGKVDCARGSIDVEDRIPGVAVIVCRGTCARQRGDHPCRRRSLRHCATRHSRRIAVWAKGTTRPSRKRRPIAVRTRQIGIDVSHGHTSVEHDAGGLEL